MATKINVFFYINIHFSSSINEGHSVDTQFCTHNLILEDDWNNHFKYPKNHSCISCIKSFITYNKNDLETLRIATICPIPQIGITYHKNDLQTLIITTICPIPKSDRRIERYHEIKFSRFACILCGWSWSRVNNWN